MPYVRFFETRTVERKGGPTFNEGRVYLLSDASAKHWVKRGVAEIVNPPAEIPVTVADTDQTTAVVVDTDPAGVAADVNSVASSSDVEEQDGGSAGVGAEHEPSGGEDRPRRGRSSNRHK